MSAGGSNRLLKPEAAADYLDVKTRTLLDNYRKWGIPVVKVGRAVRFRERALEHWIDSHTKAPAV